MPLANADLTLVYHLTKPIAQLTRARQQEARPIRQTTNEEGWCLAFHFEFVPAVDWTRGVFSEA